MLIRVDSLYHLESNILRGKNMKLRNIVIEEGLESRMSFFSKLINDINSKTSKKTSDKYTMNSRFKRLLMINRLETIEQLIRYLNSFDPTGDKATYTQWIIKIVSEGQIKLPEDGERLSKTIRIFNSVKQNKSAQIKKDINAYGDFRELEQIVSKYNETANLPNTLRQWELWIKSNGYTKLFADQVYTILKFENTGKTIKVAPYNVSKYESRWVPEHLAKEGSIFKEFDLAAVSMSYLACGTSYCVANPEVAQDYLPLFAIFKNGEFMTLADKSWYEFRNTKDVMLSKMSPHFAFFMSKAILAVGDELGDTKRLALLISDTVNSYDIKNANAKAVMIKAIESQSSKT